MGSKTPVSDLEARCKELMLRGLAGDASAHRVLLGELSVALRPFFARRLGTSAEQAEDLVQDTLIAVHTRRASYDATYPVLPWVFAIARYRLIDFARKRRIRMTEPLDEASEIADGSASESPGAARDVERLLAELPVRQREAIDLVKLKGLSVAEAAERIGQSPSAVKVNIHRGLKALRAFIERRGADADR